MNVESATRQQDPTSMILAARAPSRVKMMLSGLTSELIKPSDARNDRVRGQSNRMDWMSPLVKPSEERRPEQVGDDARVIFVDESEPE
jgi:hypothetical protein